LRVKGLGFRVDVSGFGFWAPGLLGFRFQVPAFRLQVPSFRLGWCVEMAVRVRRTPGGGGRENVRRSGDEGTLGLGDAASIRLPKTRKVTGIGQHHYKIYSYWYILTQHIFPKKTADRHEASGRDKTLLVRVSAWVSATPPLAGSRRRAIANICALLHCLANTFLF
jgi:hypothetical protein